MLAFAGMLAIPRSAVHLFAAACAATTLGASGLSAKAQPAVFTAGPGAMAVVTIPMADACAASGPQDATAFGVWVDGRYEQEIVVYPGSDGPIDSIRWEVFAESLVAQLEPTEVAHPTEGPLDDVAGLTQAAAVLDPRCPIRRQKGTNPPLHHLGDDRLDPVGAVALERLGPAPRPTAAAGADGMDLGLKGKSAFVAASSRGLGYATALALAREGCRVAINGRYEPATKSAAGMIAEETGTQALALTADVTDPQAPAWLVEDAASAFGGLDILITNAGGPPAGSFELIDEAGWRAGLDLSFMSHVRFIKAALPHLRKMRSSRFICAAGSIFGTGNSTTNRFRSRSSLTAA